EWQDADARVQSPKARFIQYRLKLSSGPAGGAQVKQADLAYLPYNLAPRVKSITILDPHIELVSTAPARSPPGGNRALPPARNRKSGQPEVRPQPREQEARGVRSARWDAEDENEDELRFNVWYRGEEETAWKKLATDIPEAFVAIDTTALPDGVYL